MFASQPRATRAGSGSPTLSRTQRSVRHGYFCAYTTPTYAPYEVPQAEILRSPRASRSRSRSRTWLAVVKLASTGPPLRAQASAVRRERAVFSVTSPSGPGHDRRLVRRRSSGARAQLAVVLPPTPRGSNATRS